MTSNVQFDGWGKLFGDEVIASAILDRLLHSSHMFAVNGPATASKTSSRQRRRCLRVDRRRIISLPAGWVPF